MTTPTVAPKTFAEMATTTTRESWFTVVDRNSGRRVAINGSFIAFEAKKDAIAHAKSLGWGEYTWAPDGR